MTLAVNIAQGGSNNVTMRNRIINGAMVIDQRYAGGAISAATLGSSGYTLDRWKYQAQQSAKFSAQQNAGSVAVQATTGFANYLGFTSASAYSITSTDYFRVMQPIEGFNGADLAWGTASAKTITISFWVYSSITGTYGVCLQNNDNNRGYVGSYTINSASTWEQKSVTIAGDTSGTWKTDNNIFAQVAFYFGAGSSQQATPGSWSASVNQAPTGQANVSGTNNATWYITGVQFEAGTTASPFEYRQYGTELALCQRYYQRTFQYGSAFGLNNGNQAAWYGHGKCHVTMRATPTASIISGVTPTADMMGAGTVTYTSGTPSGKTVNSWKFDMSFSGTLGNYYIGVLSNDCIECSAEL
jgi:hypothetical protein